MKRMRVWLRDGLHEEARWIERERNVLPEVIIMSDRAFVCVSSGVEDGTLYGLYTGKEFMTLEPLEEKKS